MPWGNPNQVTNNFVSHLQLRHKCDYDVLTDYEVDEEEWMQRALKASEETFMAQVLEESAAAVCPAPPDLGLAL